MAWVGSNLSRSSSPTPQLWAWGHLSLDQVTQSLVQPDLEHFQGWGIYHLSGQPVPVPHHPHRKEFLTYVQPKSTLFQFKTVVLSPVATGPHKSPSPSFL